MALSEEELKEKLEEIQKQLSKKQKFEEAVFSIKSLLRDFYLSSSPSLRKSLYTVICRVSTVLKTRYTAPGFWMSGLGLFEEAESLVSDSSEKEYLKKCIILAKEHLHLTQNPSEDVSSSLSRGVYLFEGHLTVDPEPPQPQWLVQSDLLNSMASLVAAAQSSRGPVDDDDNNNNDNNVASYLLEDILTNNLDLIPELLDNEARVPKVPPASKDIVANLPVITLTEEILTKLGQDADCAICKENLAVDDKMQELPCKHKFHPPCLKPWLDEHNSCPICRHELQTDDHAYESWKEREKEAEEERKGAANAVRGGEFLYI